MPKDRSYHQSHSNQNSNDFNQSTSRTVDLPRAGGFERDLSARILIQSRMVDESSNPFSVMSWNVLAQELLLSHFKLYKYCRSEAIEWHYRRIKILKMINAHTPDIFCLQEVNVEFYNELKQRYSNYHSHYLQRHQEPDGLAVFYKNQRFAKVRMRLLKLHQVSAELSKNVAIIIILRCKITQKTFLLTTTHLLWNPRNGNVKLQQLNAILEAMEDLIKEQSYYNVPILMCGDFNIVNDSFLFDYIVKGETINWIENELMSGQLEKKPEFLYKQYQPHTCPKYVHPFHFQSVYTKGYPSRMSSIVDFKASVVDHMFLGHYKIGSKNKLVVEKYLGLPMLDNDVVLPNETNPSDHLPLIASFSFEK
jgi:mRNA deadenylase 3'-5' endonuclease subunit Ccr4